MLSAEEQRILDEIERGLRRDDRWFAPHLRWVRVREALGDRRALCWAGVQAGLALAAIAGVITGQPVLLLPAIVLGLPLLAVALVAHSSVRFHNGMWPAADHRITGSGDPWPLYPW